MMMHKEHVKWYVLLALLAATALVWYAILQEDREGKLKVAFLDVGQGDAIFIESPSGKQMLIDGGPDQKVIRELGKQMPFYDRSIDLILVSNPDKDHIAGFIDILNRFRVGTVIEPGTFNDSSIYAALEEAVKEEGASRIIAFRGMKINLGGSAYFTILFPDRDISGLDTNTGSIVGKLTYRNTCFIFPGDAPAAIEDYITLIDEEYLKCEVLKVGHHGSRTSTSEQFVGLINPTYTVISLGKDNKYGHPHKEVLETLERFGAKTFRTDQLGTVLMYSDGENVFLDR